MNDLIPIEQPAAVTVVDAEKTNNAGRRRTTL